MNRYSIFRNMKFLRLDTPTAAGATDVTSDEIATPAHARLYGFAVGFGAIVSGGVQSVEVQGYDGSAWYTLLDQDGDQVKITVADTDDSKVALIEIVQPTALVKKLRVVMKRATQNATIEFCIALVDYNRSEPVVQDTAMVLNASGVVKAFVAPVLGTAV